MYNLNSNRAWKRTIAANSIVNRASRRAAAHAALAIAQAAPTVQELVAAAPVIVLGQDTAPVNQNQRVYTRPYAVRETGEESFIVIRSADAPQGYQEFKGPFKTTRGASYFTWHTDYSIAECERLSKK